MPKYVALLRGINLGKRQIKMAELKTVFEGLDFSEVSTLLASGNVVFAARETTATLRTRIEAAIQEKYGFTVPVILRSEEEIRALVAGDPFKGVKAEKGTRLYITFLGGAPTSKLKAPYKEGDFSLRQITKGHVASVLGPKTASPDIMDFLGKEFGKDITTRNWNTVLKIVKAMEIKTSY